MPVKPEEVSIDWVRGSTSPFTVIIKSKTTGEVMPYDDMRLSVFAGSALAFRLSTLDTPTQALVNGETGQVSFVPRADQTRLLIQTPDGGVSKNKYEIELRYNGSEEVYLMGSINAIGGINDDLEEAS